MVAKPTPTPLTKLELLTQIMGLLQGIVLLDSSSPYAPATEEDFQRAGDRLKLIADAFKR